MKECQRCRARRTRSGFAYRRHHVGGDGGGPSVLFVKRKRNIFKDNQGSGSGSRGRDVIPSGNRKDSRAATREARAQQGCGDAAVRLRSKKRARMTMRWPVP